MRVGALRALHGALGDLGTSRRLEQATFRSHGHTPVGYTERVRELLFCAPRVRELLAEDPDVLLLAARDTAALRSDADRAWYEDQSRAQRDLREAVSTFEDVDLLDDDASAAGPALNTCRRCGSSDVAWHQRQTRSADEAITTFFECRKCGKRWRQ